MSSKIVNSQERTDMLTKNAISFVIFLTTKQE